MRLKSILEAVAERIGCFEAHRNVWRNWILEGTHPAFGSQIPNRAASQPTSKAGRAAALAPSDMLMRKKVILAVFVVAFALRAKTELKVRII